MAAKNKNTVDNEMNLQRSRYALVDAKLEVNE